MKNADLTIMALIILSYRLEELASSSSALIIGFMVALVIFAPMFTGKKSSKND